MPDDERTTRTTTLTFSRSWTFLYAVLALVPRGVLGTRPCFLHAFEPVRPHTRMLPCMETQPFRSFKADAMTLWNISEAGDAPNKITLKRWGLREYEGSVIKYRFVLLLEPFWSLQTIEGYAI